MCRAWINIVFYGRKKEYKEHSLKISFPSRNSFSICVLKFQSAWDLMTWDLTVQRDGRFFLQNWRSHSHNIPFYVEFSTLHSCVDDDNEFMCTERKYKLKFCIQVYDAKGYTIFYKHKHINIFTYMYKAKPLKACNVFQIIRAYIENIVGATFRVQVGFGTVSALFSYDWIRDNVFNQYFN